ncbi:nitroreductase family deazaflavin-dependent oxidoreductase [Mycobacterium nebraskense]|uniref:nitroreductase family deazaflavin-dependent oxidoreductase n=1 Tax=Mycobacterium nebraskense TaxID=244292 RepID=UPI00069B86CD|nr:nitroreductase family deazaflavin-dependent oxidoreductase [Mycobacterium nebraskense]
MTTPARQPHSETTNEQFVAVGPSRTVRLAIKPLTKLLNPLVKTVAGRRLVPMMARVQHVGRRSGTVYVTPTSAAVAGDAIVVPLSFGNRSDWACNVRAAGHCIVQLRGRRYYAAQPRFVDGVDAKQLVHQAFNAIERFGFKLLGVRQFLLLRSQTIG